MDESREIERFKSDWEIDFSRKEIRRKKQNLFMRCILSLFGRPYPVITLYRFVQFHLSSEEGIVFANFIERSKSSPIAGVPTWFEMSDEWTIPERDLRSLFLGPLVRGNSVVVPALPKKGVFLTLWQFVGIVSTVGGAVTFIAWLFGG